MKSNDKEIDVREIRRKLGLNQSQFWSKIGVTQSGGSRYESGRNIPRPVQALLKLVHVEQVDISKIRRDDVDVIDYLRQTNPDMLKSLRKEAKAAKKKA
jgi:transcriptional regulator with XRE-family HTH domain